MSDVAQPKCRCWYRTFLRWLVFVVAIVTIAGSLARFCLSLNSQLSGQSMGLVATVTFGALFMPCGMSMIGSVLSKRSIREQCAVLAVLLAIVSCSLAFVYDCIGRGKPLATFYGGGGSGVVSAYEAFLVWALCLIASIIQMTLVHYDSLHREATLIVGGSLAVVGILLPKMLESYEVLQAYCAAAECDANYRLGIAWYEVSLAFSASLAALFVAGVLTPVWRPRLYQLFDPDRPCETCSPVPAHDLTDVPSSDQGDARGEAEDHGSPVVLDERKVRLVLSTVESAEPRSTTSRQLVSAAVSGVVAGVSFSVVSRLLNRR